MKAENNYLKFVRWSDEDNLYVGYCPDLFPYGGVCHASAEEAAYTELCQIVREELEELQRDEKPLPTPSTRPMRDAVPA